LTVLDFCCLFSSLLFVCWRFKQGSSYIQQTKYSTTCDTDT
jgi:hypothetical protein